MRPTNKKPMPQHSWLTFNVGGSYFSASRSTLIKGTPPNSPLHRVSIGSTNVEWDRDETGAYMIDRDPIFFRALLNYLRTGFLILSHDTPEEGVLVEAEYFNVPELIKVIKQRISSRQKRIFPPIAKVPHCYQTEIF